MPKKLWTVKISTEIVVLAENEREALKVADRAKRELVDYDYDVDTAYVLRENGALPGDWSNSEFPYSAEDEDELTIGGIRALLSKEWPHKCWRVQSDDGKAVDWVEDDKVVDEASAVALCNSECGEQPVFTRARLLRTKLCADDLIDLSPAWLALAVEDPDAPAPWSPKVGDEVVYTMRTCQGEDIEPQEFVGFVASEPRELPSGDVVLNLERMEDAYVGDTGKSTVYSALLERVRPRNA